MENKLKVKSSDLSMWRTWDDALPIGNGRLGAMFSGLPATEAITINEDSLWSVPFIERSNPEAKKYYKEIRSLLKQGRVKEADKLCFLAMSSLPKYFGAYEPVGMLWTFWNHGDDVTNYERNLDFETGVATVDYSVDGMNIHREAFVSKPDEAIVIRITADKPQLDMHFHMMRRPYEFEGQHIIDDTILHMRGHCGKEGTKFDCMVSAKTDGELTRMGDFIGFKDASEIIIYITVASDFYEKETREKAYEQIKAVMARDYEAVKKDHIADFSELYGRVSLDLCDNSKSNMSLDTRFEKLQAGEKDTGLFELMFNYARYLTISSSRPGCNPMNLQGIWCGKFAPEWDCNYTININLQMNYWMAEISQLSDCHEPLFDLIDRMVPNGERVAKNVYGCDGFVAHHATNIWGDCAINGNSFPSSLWPMGGAWLIKHMWEHYLHTQDKEFLKNRALPIMKKAALFFTQYMEEAEDGYFESGPSLSPENLYVTDDGQKGMHCMAPEMDNQIIRSLFRSVIKAYEELDCCDADYEKYKEFMGKIRPTRINKNGGIMEWDKDYKEYDPGHRHISPVFALHPDYEITPDKTPELAKACEQTFINRLNGSDKEAIGFEYWNGAWMACCYAKLRKPEKAMKVLYNIISAPNRFSRSFLNRAPVFQIEGSIGLATAVAEMLMFSDEERIMLLPALPEDFKDGSFKGLVARGGFVIDLEWKGGKAVSAKITSRADRTCRIKAEGLSGVNTEFTNEDGFIVFEAEKGRSYELAFAK